MAHRTKRGQAIHDRKLSNWVNRLRESGNQVLADLPDHPKPPIVGGRTPDLVVKQGGKIKVIGEVETPSSLKKDRSQQRDLREAAMRYGADFRLKIAKEKRR